jgi:hypothetical protein
MRAAIAQTPIPARMAHLPKDPRGYPIPFIVALTSDGAAHFTIYDEIKVQHALSKRLCGICGKLMHKRKMWMVGGPGSAFAERGAYIDGPVHYECGQYALAVCPYLAMPNYARRIDDRKVTDAQRREMAILADPTMIPEQPDVFVFAATSGISIATHRYGRMLIPNRPWLEIEYWKIGQQIGNREGWEISQGTLARLGVA